MTSENRKALDRAKAHRKEIERQHLHSFQCLCSDFPKGDLQNSERPDFLILAETQRKIGIEHTQVFKAGGGTKSPQQGIEATKEEITVAARRFSERLSSPPAHVSLFFNLGRPLKTKARVEIAQAVAQVVHDKMPPEGQSIELGPSSQLIAVDSILISRVHPVDRHVWGWPEFGFARTDAIALLEGAINEKAKRLHDYLDRCDECWLLIVAPSFKPAGMIHPDEHSLAHVYLSPFNRTYFLDFGLGNLFQLRQ
jgi:hypothetical protein